MCVCIYIYFSHTHTHKPIFMYRDRHFTAHSVVIIAFRRQISSRIQKNGRWHPLTAQQHPRAWSRRSDRTALVLALSAIRLQHVNNVSSLSSTSNTMCISIYIHIYIYINILCDRLYTHCIYQSVSVYFQYASRPWDSAEASCGMSQMLSEAAGHCRSKEQARTVSSWLEQPGLTFTFYLDGFGWIWNLNCFLRLAYSILPCQHSKRRRKTCIFWSEMKPSCNDNAVHDESR